MAFVSGTVLPYVTTPYETGGRGTTTSGGGAAPRLATEQLRVVQRAYTGYRSLGISVETEWIKYVMRAKDTSLGGYVFWVVSNTIDSTGSKYTGPGPLTDITVFDWYGTE